MARRTFPNRASAWQFMAELHPSFDKANQVTAEEIVDRVVSASGTSITGYDEGNPGSSREIRVHTEVGRIWISPTRVYVPDTFKHVDGHETEQLEGARSYLLPNRNRSRTNSAEEDAPTELCQRCFIHYPVGSTCPFCSEG